MRNSISQTITFFLFFRYKKIEGQRKEKSRKESEEKFSSRHSTLFITRTTQTNFIFSGREVFGHLKKASYLTTHKHWKFNDHHKFHLLWIKMLRVSLTGNNFFFRLQQNKKLFRMETRRSQRLLCEHRCISRLKMKTSENRRNKCCKNCWNNGVNNGVNNSSKKWNQIIPRNVNFCQKLKKTIKVLRLERSHMLSNTIVMGKRKQVQKLVVTVVISYFLLHNMKRTFSHGI